MRVQQQPSLGLVLLIISLTRLCDTAPVAAEVVTFPDANMETAIRNALGIPFPTPITDTDMEDLEYFSIWPSGISNIEGLQYAVNLAALEMPGNQISDISPIAGLTDMLQLNLSGNQISDISALSGLTNLCGIGLFNNQISDISPLAGLTNLTTLYLPNNQIETMDLRNSELGLEEFSITGNPLTKVLLTNATLSQTCFDALMDGGSQVGTVGIADVSGVLDLDMNGVDFTGISDLSRMYGMDDLEQLLLGDATNLTGSQVAPLTVELDSLDWLDVAGTWNSFDAGTQNTLNIWDTGIDNTLIVLCGDANCDRSVDVSDLGILAAKYGTTSGAEWGDGDFDYNGAVDVSDLGLLAAYYGSDFSSSRSRAVPEPGIVNLLITLFSLVLLRKRSR
ncbi:MAG: leucine-rich repeat domain-containing protein [Pirellulales bacterium]|nr:leucine-rich repeat domain-containing protein [Pirellulales bacterium]